jgi:hypothetical protein
MIDWEATMINESRLLSALKRKYRSPQELLRAMGLDEDLLESEDDMAKPVSEKASRMHADYIIAMDQRARSISMAYDGRRARDQEEMEADPDDEDDNKLEQVIELLSGLSEDRKKRAADRKKARDAAGMIGGPTSRVGGLEDPEQEGAQDSRRRGRAHDDGAVIIDEDFRRRFPEAARVGMA